MGRSALISHTILQPVHPNMHSIFIIFLFSAATLAFTAGKESSEIIENEVRGIQETNVADEKQEENDFKSREARAAKKNKNGRNDRNKEKKTKRKTARKGRKPQKSGGKRHRKSGSKTGKKGRKPNKSGPKGIKQRKLGRKSKACSISDTCFTTAISYMKIWKDNVANFEKQQNRMTKQNKTGGSKSGKKGLFAPIVQRLIEAGGGNRSNLSCNGNYTNAGANQLTNLTKVLHGCEIKINASCNPANFPKPNITLVNECSKLVTTFKDMASFCLNRTTVSAACSCWTNSTLNKTAIALKNCKISESSKAITKQLRLCTGNFSICRKFEDDTITAIFACGKSTTKLVAKAKSLTTNKNDMTTAKDKMNTLSGSSSSGKQVRATATKCSEIISKSKQITTLASDSPTSDKISTLSKEISGASVTCTETEKTSLKTEVTSMTSSIAVLTVALETVQTNLQAITGSTASSSVIAASSDDSTSSTSTAKASGRRNMLIREAMNRVKKNRDMTN